MLLTNYTPGLEKLFDIGKEIVVYTSIEDLDNKVKYYLENENERNMIAESGHQRVKRDHTYFQRSKKLIDIINEN
jgi:spore maturation protein CgeB